ncbi:hypothetical protein XELAEV_18033009mg [Xenopus laevis]|uniref:Uncharacterized protein n=1 Tax=Xenopus laevis TaxID=8355 RepID=A0A974CK02_XENLA|nr:hypothetical protein XELAEV_18033009mg [Xenopus laevis]
MGNSFYIFIATAYVFACFFIYFFSPPSSFILIQTFKPYLTNSAKGWKGDTPVKRILQVINQHHLTRFGSNSLNHRHI